MKNLFKKTMLFAAAAMAFVSCSNDATEDVFNSPSFEVEVNAVTTDSRSAFGELNGDKYPTLWSGNESWAVCINDKHTPTNNITFSSDKKSANTTVTFSEGVEANNGLYTLYTVSPASAYSSHSEASDYIRYTIPANQTPGATSCDEAAQVLIAKSESKATFDAFDVAFKHATAYANFSFKNVAEGGNVTSVSIKSNDIVLAGRFAYTISTGAIAPHDRSAYEVALSTSSTTNLWMALAPAAVSGKVLTFTIYTDKGNLSKEVTMPGDFKAGVVANFTIDMAGIDYPAVENVVEYRRVTSLSEITEGEYVFVHHSFTMTNGPATAKSSVLQVAINTKATVGDDVLTNVSDDIKWVLTGTASAMQINSYADNSYYLYNINDNNGVRVNTNPSSKTWAFEALNSGFAMKNNGRYCGVYTTGSDWRSYTSATASNYGTGGASLTLYKKVESAGGDTPDVPATPELAVNPATVEVAAAGGNAEFGYTVTNPAEGVSVVASTTVDWISGFNYATAGKVTFTVAENTVAEAREAVITLAYTGAESKTVTVSQAAAEVGGGEGGEATPETKTISFTGGSGSNQSTISFTSVSPLSCVITANGNQTSPRLDSNMVRMYASGGKSNKMTITTTSSPKKKITKVVVTATSDSYATALGGGSATVDSGASVSIATSGSTVTYTITGNTETIEILTSGQARLSKVDVTYQ